MPAGWPVKGLNRRDGGVHGVPLTHDAEKLAEGAGDNI